jgi:hypothetical protein
MFIMRFIFVNNYENNLNKLQSAGAKPPKPHTQTAWLAKAAMPTPPQETLREKTVQPFLKAPRFV